jgi:hypothetical protein
VIDVFRELLESPEDFDGGGDFVCPPNNMASVLRALNTGEFPRDPADLVVSVPAPPFLHEVSPLYETQAVFLAQAYEHYCRHKYGHVPACKIKRAARKPMLMSAAAFFVAHKLAPHEWFVFMSFVWHSYMDHPANEPPPMRMVFDLERIRKNRGWCRSETRLFPQRLSLVPTVAHYLAGYLACYRAAESGSVARTRYTIGLFFPNGWQRVYDTALAAATKHKDELLAKRNAGLFLWE